MNKAGLALTDPFPHSTMKYVYYIAAVVLLLLFFKLATQPNSSWFVSYSAEDATSTCSSSFIMDTNERITVEFLDYAVRKSLSENEQMRCSSTDSMIHIYSITRL